jgi:predicted lipoprotein with Yx(FWY)xxD motif
MNQMTHRRRGNRGFSLFRVAGAVVALGGLSAATVVSGPASAATNVVISTSKNSQFGTILVSGTALYTLKPSATPCTAQCVKVWPEVLLAKGETKAKAGSGVNAAKLGTVKRAHGALQVTYAGKPLYWFSGDTAAGQVNGNVTDTWGKWTVAATKSTKTTGSTSGSGGTAF